MLLPLALPLTLALTPVADDRAVYPPSVFPAAGAVLPTNARLVVFPGSTGTEDAAFLLRRGDQSLETLDGVDIDTIASGASANARPSCSTCRTSTSMKPSRSSRLVRPAT